MVVMINRVFGRMLQVHWLPRHAANHSPQEVDVAATELDIRDAIHDATEASVCVRQRRDVEILRGRRAVVAVVEDSDGVGAPAADEEDEDGEECLGETSRSSL